MKKALFLGIAVAFAVVVFLTNGSGHQLAESAPVGPNAIYFTEQ